MGAWGEEALANDHARDWLWELEEAHVERQLRNLFVLVLAAPRGDLPVGIGEEAMAAAEVVATAGGRPPSNLPPDCAQAASWINSLDRDLIAMAIAVVDRVEADSELRDAWEESGGSRSWRNAVQELRVRLTAARV